MKILNLIKLENGIFSTIYMGEKFESSNFKEVWLFANGYGKDQAAELRYEAEKCKRN